MLSAHRRKKGDGQVPVVRLIHGSFSSLLPFFFFDSFSFLLDCFSFDCLSWFD